jgi:hypothetical protein
MGRTSNQQNGNVINIVRASDLERLNNEVPLYLGILVLVLLAYIFYASSISKEIHYHEQGIGAMEDVSPMATISDWLIVCRR